MTGFDGKGDVLSREVFHYDEAGCQIGMGR